MNLEGANAQESYVLGFSLNRWIR